MSPFFLRDSRADETRERVKITPREKGETRRERKNEGLQTKPTRNRVSLAFRSLYYPREKMGTTSSLDL